MNQKLKSTTLAVLITCHNRKTNTIQCLAKLFQQENIEKIQFEVFLVDDGSSDGTTVEVNKIFPKVNTLQGDGNLFWNRGMYTAWKEASKNDFDFYLWLNDDTILFENALNSFIEIYKNYTNSILVGSTCSKFNGKIITYGGRKSDRNFTLIEPNNQILECDTFNGNCVLIPKNIFTKIGNLDYYFRHSFGDIEYGLRAKKAGFKSFVMPNIIGTCERNVPKLKLTSTQYSIIERIKFLYSPLGFNPFESFYLNKKYSNFGYASLVFVKLHLNVIFPFLLKQK